MNRFDGKKVLITGGSRGIGLATAEAFVAQGAEVVIAGRTRSSVEQALASRPLTGARGVAGDVSSAGACAALVEQALDLLGGLDVLVNSAGVFESASIEQTDEQLWDRVIDANLKGSYFCSRAAVPALRQRRGNIVHLGSESGVNGYGGSTAYCASKGAIVNLARAMAMELAPQIRVNTVCPGVVETDMALAGFAIDGDQQAGMQQQREQYPLKRVATAAEVASAILYLASDDARFITGESLVMDGGATVGK